MVLKSVEHALRGTASVALLDGIGDESACDTCSSDFANRCTDISSVGCGGRSTGVWFEMYTQRCSRQSVRTHVDGTGKGNLPARWLDE